MQLDSVMKSEKIEKNEKSQKMFKIENDPSQRVSVKNWPYKRHLDGFYVYFVKKVEKIFFEHVEATYSTLKMDKK